MANAQLAKSIFSRTPDQETIVADVYQKTTPEAVNSFQDITGTSTDLYDQFSFLSKFNSGQKLVGPTVEGAASLKDQVNAALPDGASKEKSLISDTLGSIKSTVKTATSIVKTAGNTFKTATQAYSQINGVVQAVKNGNLKDIRGITNTLNAITGKTTVLLSANGPVGKLYGQVVDQASMAGISDAFGVVAGAVKESTTLVNKGAVLHQMASVSMPGALKRGDYLSVSSMASNLGDGVVGMMDSGAVKKLAANMDAVVPSNQIKGQFYDYKGAYKKIDPKWNVSSFAPAGGTPLPDITKLITAAPETKKVFAEGAKQESAIEKSEKFYAALNAELTARSVEEDIKRRYPNAIPGDGSGLQKRDVDPRIAAAADSTSIKFYQPGEW